MSSTKNIPISIVMRENGYFYAQTGSHTNDGTENCEARRFGGFDHHLDPRPASQRGQGGWPETLSCFLLARHTAYLSALYLNLIDLVDPISLMACRPTASARAVYNYPCVLVISP